MNHSLFTGACTALVTPFINDQINYPMLEQLIHRQISAGIAAIVIAGTTGEAATLSDSEKIELYRRAKEYANGKCLIIAGTGSNSTSHAVALSMAAEQAGADALLVVSPYYNKATEEGLYEHYRIIANSVRIPVILYNVPSRTGIDIPVSVYQKLSQIPNIAGVKEAKPDIAKIEEIRYTCGDRFTVWSGNDDMTVPLIALGCSGVISVLSNIEPELVQAMANAALDGDFDTASSLQVKLYPIIHTLFSQVNPIPIKAAMRIIGYDCGGCRLPLTEASEVVVNTFKNLLQTF